MKAICFLFLCFFTLNFGFPQNDSDLIFDNITAYVSKADYKNLSHLFSPSVDMIIPSNSGNYSKTQAEMILKEFFNKYPPTSFVILNKGKNSELSKFAIAEYKSSGENFRAYFFLKKISGTFYLQQIKFEKD